MLLLYTYIFSKITDVNLSAFIYRLFHQDFSSILGTNPERTNLHISYKHRYCRIEIRS